MLPIDENLDQELRSRLQAWAEDYDIESGLLNIRTFQEATELLLQHAKAAQTQVALIWVDLLNLPREFVLGGKSCSDTMVQQVATTLCDLAGPQAIVGRFNGSSFLMATLVSDCVQDGVRFAQLVSDELMPKQYRNQSRTEIATGVAFYPSDTTSGEELMRYACLASQQARQLNNAQVVTFNPELLALLRRKREVEEELELALDHNQLTVAYQPKIDLITGQVQGAEALIRWNHPVWGEIPPNDFIPIAENSGLIHRIFDFVLRTALQDTQRWNSHGLVLPVISVNTSVANLRQPDFAYRVREILKEYPVAPASLEVEVTESMLFEHESLFIERLHMLRQIGIRIALDDFGTRYTGIDLLSRVPLDSMKIDKCFVRGIDRSADLRALCHTVIAMARQLKMSTIAEGIERDGELNVMQQMGCDAGQGFLFQKALPAEEFTAFLRSWAGFEDEQEFVSPEDLAVVEPLLES